ncbi:hypothetical protein BO86DRAFT_390712 [Aspergillus japonicus CBS 114.51]|uniref:Uncharacterized protein n=1 Tax=Aspergillus japonicus CBS 114.51 TaxID=1448312 RepID=A0A8T8WVE4_ASPJA|nr:hypothetical protein BO86DRAFT_390712 [Aspergillus japonicus CBS 114.51]RAH79801.1 hypothetical protein BO86DRAFT_390712 [Aspergillus japonicus CBS 114.51]
MSHFSNPDSVANPQQGEFKPSVKPTAPLEEGGVCIPLVVAWFGKSPASKLTVEQHQPGRKVAPADFAPEFRAQTHPAGTAPASSSYSANTTGEVGGQALNPNVERSHGKESVKTSAADTLMGATSQDVHTGLGHPGSGQTSAELRHDGQPGRKRQTAGLEKVGAYADSKFERDIPGQRALDREEGHLAGQRGDKGALAAEDRQPEPATTAAAEWKYEPGTKRDNTHKH